MDNVFVKLYSYYPAATSAEQNIIDRIIENSEDLLRMNVREFASTTFTSPSTVIRLVKKLGFEGFLDFRNSLIYDFATRNQTKDTLVEDVSKEDDLDDIIEKVTRRNIISLQNTEKLLSRKDIELAVRYMAEADKINLFGMGSSLLVAKDTSLKFLRIDKDCSVYDDWHNQLIMAKNTKDKELSIIFSYSGKTREMLECAEAIKARSGKIILITGFENSPISRFADIVLTIAATEYLFRSGAMSSRIAQMNLVDILYTAYINKNYEESIKRIGITHIKKNEEESK